jgi:hypothetical protein
MKALQEIKESIPEIEIKDPQEQFIETAIFLLNNSELEDIIKFFNSNKEIFRIINMSEAKFKVKGVSLLLMYFHKILDFLNIDFEILVGEYTSNDNKKRVQQFLMKTLNHKIYNKFNFSKQKISETCKQYSFTLMLKFKNVEITNTVGLKNLMPAINFMLPISVSRELHDYYGENCHVIRPVVTKSELISNYNFSHSQGDCYSLNDNLCYGGSDTQINKKINEFFNFFNTNSIYKNSTFDCFISIFSTIDSYLRWESLEGTPYKYIRNIKNANAVPYNYSDTLSLDKSNFDFLMRRIVDNHIDKKVIKDTLVVSVDSDVSNNSVVEVEIIDEEFYHNLTDFKASVDSSGNVVYMKINRDSVNINNKYLYTDIKGNDVRISLQENVYKQLDEKRITLTLKKIIEKKIKYYFNKNLYDKYIKKTEKC